METQTEPPKNCLRQSCGCSFTSKTNTVQAHENPKALSSIPVVPSMTCNKTLNKVRKQQPGSGTANAWGKAAAVLGRTWGSFPKQLGPCKLLVAPALHEKPACQACPHISCTLHSQGTEPRPRECPEGLHNPADPPAPQAAPAPLQAQASRRDACPQIALHTKLKALHDQRNSPKEETWDFLLSNAKKALVSMISAPTTGYTTHINTKLQEGPQAYLSSSLTSINVVFIPKYVLQKAL